MKQNTSTELLGHPSLQIYSQTSPDRKSWFPPDFSGLFPDSPDVKGLHTFPKDGAAAAETSGTLVAAAGNR